VYFECLPAGINDGAVLSSGTIINILTVLNPERFNFGSWIFQKVSERQES